MSTAFEYEQIQPDRGQIELLVKSLFRHASPGGYVSLRAFPDNENDTKPFRISPVRLTERDDSLDFLIGRACDDAYRAANDPKKIVFCPPIAVFSNPDKAGEADLLEGIALSVECDQKPQEARKKLEELLGPATLVVESGGKWTNPDTGETEPKLHLHWRLARPARGEDLPLLKEARKLAAVLVGADPSNLPAVHPIRWPGSWHRKGDPVLCSIDTAYPDNEIDLAYALKILKIAAPKTNGSANDKSGLFGDFASKQYQRPDDTVELMDKIRSGESYHDPLVRLAARFIGGGMRDHLVVAMLQDLMNSSVGSRDDGRWHARYSEIDRIVSTARAKYARPEEEPPGPEQEEPDQGEDEHDQAWQEPNSEEEKEGPRIHWRVTCIMSEGKNPKPLPILANVMMALRMDPNVKNAVARDNMMCSPMLMHAIGDPTNKIKPRPWDVNGGDLLFSWVRAAAKALAGPDGEMFARALRQYADGIESGERPAALRSTTWPN